MLHRDYIWEVDYGERRLLFKELAALLDAQDEYQLGMLTLFINNNPYSLELFVVLGYEDPDAAQIETMKIKLQNVGARFRPDITIDELIRLNLAKRFNSVGVSTRQQLDDAQSLFWFHERDEMGKRIPMGPLGNRLPVFLSHSSQDKLFVEEIIPYLTRYGTPVWYDKINIDYGQSIVTAIQNGIKNSGAVLFFVSPSFLQSHWCKNEMESVLHRYASGHQVLLLTVVFPEVLHDELPMFLQNLKYLRLSSPISSEEVAKELGPSLRRHFKL